MICLSCVSEVNKAYSFRIKCENSDITLRQIFNDIKSLESSNAEIDDVNCKILETSNQSIELKQQNQNHQLQTKFTANEIFHITEVNKTNNEISMIESDYNDNDNDDINNCKINDRVEFLEQEKDAFIKNDSFGEIEQLYTMATNDDSQDQENDIEQEKNILNIQEINMKQQFENSDDINREEILILECANCGETFDDTNQFQTHTGTCLKEEKSENLKQKTNPSKKHKIPLKCQYCLIEFVHLKNLEKHINKHHEKNKNRINTEEENNIHIEEQEQEQEENYSNSEFLIQEIDILNLKHNQQILNTPFKCYNCGAGFVKKKSLSFHLKLNKCTEEQFGCVSCKKVFINKQNLIEHMKTHFKFSCSKCSKSFSNKDKLKDHVNIEHKNLKKNQCSYCGKAFSMKSSLKDHLRIHNGEKPFLCSFCGKAFSQNANLKQHMMRHNSIKPFNCNQCNSSFVSKGELNSHLRRHTGEHPFICDICNSSFTTSSSLVKHSRRHTGERPYACEYCPMRFTVLGVLKNHRRTHTGEKPYVCKFCSRSFAQKSDCLSHMRAHTGEKPYKCTICNQSFQQCGSLKLHMKSIHNIIYVKQKQNQINNSEEEEEEIERNKKQKQQQQLDSEVFDDILSMQVDNDVLSDSCLK